jgi:CRP-like cAMP-binding protein
MSSDLSILRRISPFSGLDEPAFSAFRDATTLASFAAGDVLAEAGAPIEAAYILVEGEASEEWPDGITRYSEPGTILMPRALIGVGTSAHAWRADSAITARRLPCDAFDALFEAGSPAAHALLVEVTRYMSIQLRDLNRAFNDLFKFRSFTQERPAIDDEG